MPTTYAATRDVSEIATRMKALWEARGLRPAVTLDASRYVAVLGSVEERAIDGGPYIIDRSRPRPQHVIQTRVPLDHAFELEIKRMPMLPQIITQYFAPPSPRGGILQSFVNKSPSGEALSTRYYFAPDADRPTGPYLVIQLDAGMKVERDLVDAVFDRIQPKR